jgi:hypothetical protein
MTLKTNTHNSKPTIENTARISCVSTQTISRVLNERSEVSPKTRQRVLEVIDQFHPGKLLIAFSKPIL